MKHSLIIGYGNPNRQDDGIAWHVLRQVAQILKLEAPMNIEESFPTLSGKLEFLFVLQLVPEIGEIISKYSRVCFVDAHTEAIAEEIQTIELTPKYQRSAFTHHMTPQTCLEIAHAIYGATVDAFLVSVRGYHFEFSDHLSPESEKLVPIAAGKIMDWLQPSSDE